MAYVGQRGSVAASAAADIFSGRGFKESQRKISSPTATQCAFCQFWMHPMQFSKLAGVWSISKVYPALNRAVYSTWTLYHPVSEMRSPVLVNSFNCGQVGVCCCLHGFRSIVLPAGHCLGLSFHIRSPSVVERRGARHVLHACSRPCLGLMLNFRALGSARAFRGVPVHEILRQTPLCVAVCRWAPAPFFPPSSTHLRSARRILSSLFFCHTLCNCSNAPLRCTRHRPSWQLV